MYTYLVLDFICPMYWYTAVTVAGKMDSDPHLWMPMTLAKDAYVSLMEQKKVSYHVDKSVPLNGSVRLLSLRRLCVIVSTWPLTVCRYLLRSLLRTMTGSPVWWVGLNVVTWDCLEDAMLVWIYAGGTMARWSSMLETLCWWPKGKELLTLVFSNCDCSYAATNYPSCDVMCHAMWWSVCDHNHIWNRFTKDSRMCYHPRVICRNEEADLMRSFFQSCSANVDEHSAIASGVTVDETSCVVASTVVG